MNTKSTKPTRCACLAIAAMGVAVLGNSQSHSRLIAEDNTPVKPAPTATDSSDIESFDKVWETVRDNHWEQDYGGIDWDLAKTELRPKVEQARTRAEVREIMAEMIGRLGVSHFGIIPGEAYDALNDDDEDAGTGGEAGMEIRLRNGKITVARVTPGGSAEKAGVKPGWTIERIGKKDQAQLLEAAAKASDHGPMRMDTTVGLLGERGTRGEPGKSLAIEFKDLNGNAQTPEIVLAKAEGTMAKFGHLPKMRVVYETKQLEADVTYFAFNLFFDPPKVMTAFKAAVEQAKSSKGLVIDLRGNHGGIAGMTFGMASAFATESGKMGVMKMRKQEMVFPLFPTLEPYTGPVAVLIDECSISSAEILSGGMQDQKMARLFGTTTAGLALPSTVIKLPNGDALQYAFATYTSSTGKVLEGVGVIPDESIAPTSDELSKNSDPVLARAVQWIQEQSKPGVN